MKFGVVNKSTILNRFVLHTLQRNITRLAVITRKTNIKLGILKGGGGGTGKEPRASKCNSAWPGEQINRFLLTPPFKFNFENFYR